MTITRRNFLRAMGVYSAGVATGACGLLSGCAGHRFADPALRPRHRVLADLHAHAVLDDWNDTTPFARRYPLLVDAVTPLANRTKVDWDRCHAAGVDLLCVAHYNIFDEMMSMPVDPDPGAARRTHAMLDQLEGDLRKRLSPYARFAGNKNELKRLLAVDKQTEPWRIAVVHTLEGAHAIGGDLKNIDEFTKRGVASMTITHFLDKGVGSSANALPYFPDMGAAEAAVGLHDFGKELIQEMERCGMIVDVTHLTSTALDDVLANSERPLLASHASARALGDHPYSLTDEHAREITRRGGMIGVLLYPMLLSNYSGPAEAKRWGSLRDTVRTVRHLVKVCGGHEQIAIGSDFGAYITPPKEMKRLGDISILRAMLLDEFGDEMLVEDVMANNAIAFLSKHWGAMRRIVFIFAFMLSTTAAVTHAFTDEEHRHLALRAFEQIKHMELTIAPEVLAEICVRSSLDDMSPARFHVRGKSVFEQAATITPERLKEIVASVLEHPPTNNAFGPYAGNVVANYLAYHTIALRCAQKGGAEWTEHAFIFEAVALGYLADAFSSSHLLTPAHLPLTSLQDANVRTAHEFFATQGAYVYSGFDVWQAFGDGLLQWYVPAYERVTAACEESVSAVAKAIKSGMTEVLTAATINGRVGMIPSVIVATWRHPQVSLPQFREDGLHDPELRVDRRFLYSRTAFPGVRFPSGFETPPAHRLARGESGPTSVEYHQTLDFPPAFAGLLLMTGGGALVGDDGGGGVGSVAAEYAWDFAMPLLSRVRTSLELEYLYRLGHADRRVVVPRYGLGLGSPVVPGIEAVHFEVGYAWGLHSVYKDQGVKWGVGIGTKPLRFPFTYAGVSARIKYERFWMDEGLDGFQLQLIFR